MVKFYNSLSPTTKLLIQSFLAVLGAALAGAVTAAYQSYILSNKLDFAVLVNVALVTFALLFGKAMHDWVPANIQQLLQAANDEKGALYNALQQSQQVSKAVIASQGSQVQSVSPQAQIQPIDVQALSQQLAVNLMNMAKSTATPITPTSNPNAFIKPPGPVPYEDPLYVSMKLPAYTRPVDNTTNLNMAGGTADSFSSGTVTFSAPARPAMP